MNSREVQHTVSMRDDSTTAPFSRAGSRTAWRQATETTDLVELLANSPSLCSDRSVIVSMALEEFLRLRAASPDLSPSDYCRRFTPFGSAIHSSIYRQIEVERYLEDNNWLSLGAADVNWPAVGDQHAGLTVLEELGKGALARVYLCAQPDLGQRQVIVKLGRAGGLEAHTMGRLLHPNIVPVLSIQPGSAPGISAICMPFMGRSTLHSLSCLIRDNGAPQSGDVVLRAANLWQQPKDRIVKPAGWDKRAVPLADYSLSVAYLGERLADALAHAHELGIVHGDIKPSNVLLTPEGEPVLMDFNLSGDETLSMPAWGGTLPYMPPEQLAAISNLAVESPPPYDARSDIFSLGVVLFELLSGRHPFDDGVAAADETVTAETMLKRQQEGFPPLATAAPRASARLVATIESCLALNPELRPASAAILRDQLRIELRPTNRIRRRFAVQKRRTFVASAFFSAGVFCMTGWAAARPPLHERAYRNGWAARLRGDFAAAEEAFARAYNAKPDFHEARFEEARSALYRGDRGRAANLLLTLALDSDYIPCAYYAAYTQCLVGSHGAAIPLYELAGETLPESAAIHNNLAVAYDLGGSRLSLEDRVTKAIGPHLSAAMDLDPNSPVIQLNWILYERKRHYLLQIPVSDQALRIARDLCRANPRAREAVETRAYLLAESAQRDGNVIDEGLDALNAACRLGFIATGTQLRRDPTWSVYHGHARFGAICDFVLTDRPRPVALLQRLMEPGDPNRPLKQVD